MFGDCIESVPLLIALLRGTDGACIDISMPSVIAMVAGFMAAVIAIHFVATRILRLVFSKPAAGRQAPTGASPEPAPRDMRDDGPIRSNRTM